MPKRTPAVVWSHLRRTLRHPPHPWWPYLPASRRLPQHKLRLHGRRFTAWLKQRRQMIIILVGLYLLGCFATALWGMPLLALVAALPLLLVPPVGWMVYWLVWKEFHS